MKAIRIVGVDTKLTDYQIKIDLDSTNFPFEKCRADGYDVRFIDSDGQSLDYWLESWSELNRTATLWSKIPEIPSRTDKMIWMIYGNPSASSVSDGDATFGFFDDFTIGNFNKWSTAETPTITEGIATIDSSAEGILGNNGYATEYSWRSRYKCNIIAGTGRSIEGWNDAILSADSPYEVFNAFTDSPYRRTLQSGVPISDNLASSFLGVYHIYEIMRGGVESTLFYINDDLKRTSTASNIGTLYPNYMMYSDGGQIDIDWVFVRKYNDPEPQVIVL